jgi:voltage-gated potassium channel Kch
MKKPSLRQRFRYWFDGVMARGTGALLGVLALATALVIVIDAVVVFFLNRGSGGDRPTMAQAIWDNTIRILGTDDVAGSSTFALRVAMIVIAFVGVFVVANLIGIVSGAFDQKVAELRKGRSTVLESGHTVILGWNSKMTTIVQELCAANLSTKRGVIVILAERDKVEMEDEIRSRIPKPGKTTIICRSGSPLDQDDLLIASPFRAKAVIILADETGDDPDSRAIKTALALTRHPKRPEGSLHIVGQIHRPENLEVAKIVGGDEATWILGSEKVGQITAQTSRQPGLSAVYQDLLDFGGVEIYFTHQSALTGETFFDAQLAFPTTTPIGILRGDAVLLNPSADEKILPHDQLIVVSEDDSTIALGVKGVPHAASLVKGKRTVAKPEKTLILGANQSLPHILHELNLYAAKGSTVTVVSEFKVGDLGKYSNLTLAVTKGSTTARHALEAIKPASFSHVIVASYRDNLPVQEADTKTLVTLLHLRDMMSRSNERINVVSEMLDERNRKLAEVCQIDDFIVSDHLVSLMMTQISENPELSAVFADLFSSQGSEIYLRPADWYVAPGAEVDFYTVLAGARARNETAFGYMVAAEDGLPARVVLNPGKADVRAFADKDRIIVLAEN